MTTKRIDFEAEDFDVDKLELIGRSGKVYKYGVLSAGRFATWEKAWLAAEYNMNPHEVFKTVLDAINALKKTDAYSASVVLSKAIEGVARIADEMPHHNFVLFCCYFNTESEDVSKLSTELVKEKIDDLSDYAAQDLFLLAGLLTPGLISDYQKSIQSSLEQQRKPAENQTLNEPK